MSADILGGAAIRAAEDRERGDRPGRHPDAEPATGSRRPLRILIIEDEAVVAMSLGAVVEQFGHEVAGTVATGRGAIAEAARLEPDLVLMDVRLADNLDGISAAERIVAERPVGVIFLTAYSDNATVERISRLGATVLSKPVPAEALRKTIAAVGPQDPSSGPDGGAA